MTRSWLLAALVFATVALGTLALTLLVEWLRALRAQRRTREQLKRVLGEGPGTVAADASALYRRSAGPLPAWLRPVAERLPHTRDMEAVLQQAALDWSVKTYLILMTGFAGAVGLGTLIATGSWLFAVPAAAVGASLPYLYVRRKRTLRMRAFEERLPEAIDLLGRALRAGHPLSAGLGMVAEEAPQPVGGEFRQVFEEQRFGMPFDESLYALADRVPLIDVRIFISAVLVQREVGGNLAEILDKLATLIRARFTLARQLRVITAQGRLSGYVLGGLPVALALMMLVLETEATLAFMTHPIGRYVMGFAGVLQGIGFVWIQRIVDIKM